MAPPRRDRPPLALITGPTASGKSARALALARAENGVVINADSAQVYRDLRILSARPTPEEEAAAPHRLFGHVDGAVACSAAGWAAEAAGEVAAAHAAGRMPILVGGTGLYLRTLLNGIAPVPLVAEDVRGEVRALAVEDARAALEREDPAAAARLGPRDIARIARALEVIRATGRSILDWRGERHGGIADRIELRPLILDPPVTVLDVCIAVRAKAMLAGGALDEMTALRQRGLPSTLPVMRAIGVPPLLAHLAGKITLDEARARLILDTRRYAKRQRTWARHQWPADWPREA